MQAVRSHILQGCRPQTLWLWNTRFDSSGSAPPTPPVFHRGCAPDSALFAKWDWWPNTLHAHRLMALASRHGKGRHAKEALFRLACVGGPRARGRWSASAATARQATAVRPPHPPLRSYEEGQNLSDLEVLVAAGRHLGLPDVESYLQGDCGRAEVLADDAHGKRE